MDEKAAQRGHPFDWSLRTFQLMLQSQRHKLFELEKRDNDNT